MKSATVITACYNSADTIEATFESMLLQLYRPLQYIVVDGDSNDGTKEIIEQYADKFEAAGIRFNWLSEEDKGIFDAWNKGLKLSDGDWISFLGADDRYKPEAISILLDATLNKDFDFVTSRCRFVKGEKTVRIFGEPWNWNVFRKEMRILHSGGFHNSQYFQKYGPFDTNFNIAGDYELLLRAGKDLKVAFVDQILVDMDASGVSSTEVKNSLKEAKKAKLKNNVRSPIAAGWDEYWARLKIKIKRCFGK